MIKSRLKVLLAEHDMSQKELAEITGIRPTTISDICKNLTRRIPVDAMDKICKALNCDVGDIWHCVPDDD